MNLPGGPDRRILHVGEDITLLEAHCDFASLGRKMITILAPPLAQCSEAELLHQVFTGLSFEERADLTGICFDQKCTDNISSTLPFLIPNEGIYEFHHAPAANDDELCPGCGHDLTQGVNPLCENSQGCGRIRQIPDSTPRSEDE